MNNSIFMHINQTPELCMIAVKQNGIAIKNCLIQTDELIIAAIDQSIYAIFYLYNRIPANSDVKQFIYACSPRSLSLIIDLSSETLMKVSMYIKEVGDYLTSAQNEILQSIGKKVLKYCETMIVNQHTIQDLINSI